MTFETEGLLIVAFYLWLPSASYVLFLTTLVHIWNVIWILSKQRIYGMGIIMFFIYSGKVIHFILGYVVEIG